MTRPTRTTRLAVLVGIALAVVVAVVWWRSGGGRASRAGDRDTGRTAETKHAPGVMRFIDGTWQRVDPRDPRAKLVPRTPNGMVRVAGMVYEGDRRHGVGGVEVVFSGFTGEATTMSDADGRYALDVTPGPYRAFVRGDDVLSVGPRVHDRLPSPPQPGVAGVPDDQVAPVLLLAEDQNGIDLAVVRGGRIVGKVVDRSGHPIEGAVVRAVNGDGMRPVLGSDFAETDADGAYRIEVPAGGYRLEASHDRYAGVDDDGAQTGIFVEAGQEMQQDLVLVAGCVIEGTVVLASGAPSGDGALEKQWGDTDNDFGPAGKVDSDGHFRWTTTETAAVVLRAWPWKSPPTPYRKFECREGARYKDVVFTVPDREPDMAGVVVTADGEPARYAFLDITALSGGGINQQERADGDGAWGVYAMPPGDYRIRVFVADAGVVTQTVTSPNRDIRLVLGGTGAIAGKTAGLDAGSFTLELGVCDDDGGDRTHREVVVPVHNGTYRIDGIPACDQAVTARAPDHQIDERVTVPVGGVATLDLDLAPKIHKHLVGVVTDPDGKPVEGAVVTYAYADNDGAITDAQGRFDLDVRSGDGVYATKGDLRGFIQVGDAAVPVEHADIHMALVTIDEQLLEGDEDSNQ